VHEQAPPAASPPANPPAAGFNPTLRNVGIVTASVGVAAVATGIILGVSASSDASQLEQRASQRQAWSAADQSLYNQGGTFTTTATALYVVGGVAVATGTVLAILGWHKKGAESLPTAWIAPGPGGASFVLRSVF